MCEKEDEFTLGVSELEEEPRENGLTIVPA